MKLNKTLAATLTAAALAQSSARADERRFTYVYEPETLPAGVFEVENWLTLGKGRNSTVGQKDFTQLDFRQELEYGVSDRYSVSFYVNEQYQTFVNPGNGQSVSDFQWTGVSLENRYNVLNPASNPVGLTLYLEGTVSDTEAEIEEKIILGQRHGDWKWAFNLENENEWEDDFGEFEGKVGASFGVARDLGKNWSLGLEIRGDVIMPQYEEFENAAVFVGPVLSYHRERWWAALTVMPQIYGWDKDGAVDGNPHLELEDHEKVNVRLIFGVNF